MECFNPQFHESALRNFQFCGGGVFFLLLCIGAAMSCSKSPVGSGASRSQNSDSVSLTIRVKNQSKSGDLRYVVVRNAIKVQRYFHFMDSLIARDSSLLRSGFGEYILVHSNPWILDSLCSFDYDIQRAKGVFLYDQSQRVIFHEGDSLIIPATIPSDSIIRRLKSTVLDVNIPEFKLRIVQSGDTLLSCPIRVGRNEDEYLEVLDRVVNLKTPIGEGEIVSIMRTPDYIDQHTGKKYEETLRDDRKRTKMPIIPSVEPAINGIRSGSIIHATTNAATLKKPYSHGCIGTTEADAWIIYYNAPIGTKVIFRYRIKIRDERGDSVMLKDIYRLYH